MGRSKSKAKLAAKSRLKRDIEKSAAAKNAFEQIRTRKKFNVLGKKTKGDTKRTTQLRSAAVEKVCGRVFVLLLLSGIKYLRVRVCSEKIPFSWSISS